MSLQGVVKTGTANRRSLAVQRAKAGREAGLGKWTALIFCPIIAAGLYSAYVVGPFYYYYFSLKEQMKQLTRVAGLYPDRELVDKLYTHIKRYKLPIDKRDIKIQRSGRTIRIYTTYEEVFSIPWQGEDHEIHTFEFVADVDGEYD